MTRRVKSFLPVFMAIGFLVAVIYIGRNPLMANAASINLFPLGILRFDDGIACYKGKPGKVKLLETSNGAVEKFTALVSAKLNLYS